LDKEPQWLPTRQRNRQWETLMVLKGGFDTLRTCISLIFYTRLVGNSYPN
jgi:hypothetical protein